ncbi:hypothetical protein HPB52_020335 [Rhipicephalus sanguineus]|uniref:Transposase n=1 Tax=Rhipicephalus sanguineus TaxID=34632 RepID=A0A9D4PTG6_RHISA|nr:hypothetical protein HPB52_020335 [Rhipicephalus sanguineus]
MLECRSKAAYGTPGGAARASRLRWKTTERMRTLFTARPTRAMRPSCTARGLSTTQTELVRSSRCVYLASLRRELAPSTHFTTKGALPMPGAEVDRPASVADSPHDCGRNRQGTFAECIGKTTRRQLKGIGLRSCMIPQKPHLLAKERHKRPEFANSMEEWSMENWYEVIFSDQSTFPKRSDQQPVFASSRCFAAVWGAMIRSGLGPLVRAYGPLDSDAYVNIIQNVFLPYALDGPFLN